MLEELPTSDIKLNSRYFLSICIRTKKIAHFNDKLVLCCSSTGVSEIITRFVTRIEKDYVL